MGELVFATTLFVGSHFFLSSTAIRRTVTARTGLWPYLGAYSVIAIASLIWMIWAYVNAPYIELWRQTQWTRWLPSLVMPFALILMVHGYAAPNPTMVGQRIRASAHDPAPGILKITRHPIMWGIALWALSHIPGNGDVAALILFGGMVLLALGGAAHLDHRQRITQPDAWRRFADVTSYTPFVAIIRGHARFSLADYDWIRLLTALVVFGVLLFVHRWLTGVSAWPG
ncbi:MAG: NnrU family protein [Acidiferrobacterales bacterium]